MSHAKTQQRVAHIYNPENQTPEELIESFVIRTRIFKKIYNSINTTSLDEPPQHFLIEGQRGTGKTSLMLRIRYELESKDGAAHLLPIQLPEEQYGIFDLCRLWENIADYLHDEPGFEDLSEQLDTLADQEDYPTLCFTVLNEFLLSKGKRLVLFIDNFGDMLDRFTDLELKRLRDIFHTSKHIQLIAASAQTLEYTYKYEQPFFEFFKIIRLKNLNKSDAVALLRQLAKRYGAENEIDRISNKEPERIETIRLLTGGVPRTVVLLFEIFLDKSGNVFEDLEALLDRVTPLYKHRMDGLKPQQQAIIDVIALSWDGIGTADIVKGLKGRGFDNKKVSAQLAALTKNDLVSSRLIDKKNKIYFIRERFFNIWYLMRLGRRKNGDRVLWLVKFLKEWYAPKELINRTRQHIESAKKGELNLQGAYLMGEAFAQILLDMELQDELLTETRTFLSSKDKHLAETLSISNKTHFKQAINAFKAHEYQASIDHLKKITFSSSNGAIDNNIGLNYAALENYDEAVTYYHRAIDKGNTDAMFNLGLLYVIKLKDFDKAIEFYQQAVNKGHTSAMFNLGRLYQIELQDFDKAIELYQLAIDNKGDIKAMNALAWLYFEQNKNEQLNTAIKLVQKAISLNNDPIYLDTLANLHLWEKNFEASDMVVREIFAKHNYQPIIRAVTDYFIFLLARKQLHAAHHLFIDFPKLQDEIKPVYYTLMTLLKDEYPKEYLKMGEELETTVSEILDKVESVRKKYVK
ncbi:MAG: tetratricopeptide repeat protein [Desulfobulbaceae bacterium]|nr:tetratricopeptide repeat protein [Desulfobulbaceae bacterium]